MLRVLLQGNESCSFQSYHMRCELRENILERGDKVSTQPREPNAAHAQVDGPKSVQNFTDPGSKSYLQSIAKLLSPRAICQRCPKHKIIMTAHAQRLAAIVLPNTSISTNHVTTTSPDTAWQRSSALKFPISRRKKSLINASCQSEVKWWR